MRGSSMRVLPESSKLLLFCACLAVCRTHPTTSGTASLRLGIWPGTTHDFTAFVWKEVPGAEAQRCVRDNDALATRRYSSMAGPPPKVFGVPLESLPIEPISGTPKPFLDMITYVQEHGLSDAGQKWSVFSREVPEVLTITGATCLM